MYYAVTSGEDYVLISSADGVQMIAKRQIIGVVITGLQKVRIDTKNPGNSYCLSYADILKPGVSSVFELRDAINEMLHKNVTPKTAKAA